jgi:hypothetical protein
MDRYMGGELPGNIPYSFRRTCMDESIELWGRETDVVLDEIHDYILNALEEFISDHFSSHKDRKLAGIVL